VSSIDSYTRSWRDVGSEAHRGRNVGAGALAHGGDNNGPSGILRALIKGDKVGAAKAFDNWHIPSEITSRRNAERQQFKGTVPIQARIP
jgi:hypothetical protein